MSAIYLKSYLLEMGHFDLRPMFRWFTDEESDWWLSLERKWKETERKEKLNRYQAQKLYFPRLHEIKVERGNIDKDEIRSRIDMVALYQSYFPEKQVRNGNRYRQVSCFRHEDKVASLSIDTELKRINCFACGIKGDCFDFVQEMENCGFKEALSILNRL